jgi:predicted amidohydrolase YtcJ
MLNLYQMKNLYPLFIFILLITSCQKEQADLIVVNANAYTVNSSFDNAEAFAIKDGKFIAVGTTSEIEEKYQSENIVDAKNQTIVPGLIDAHCHFYRMGLQQQKVDLEGTTSYDDVLQKLVAFQKEKNTTYITGRGWDQNDWEVKEFPTKETRQTIPKNSCCS